MRVVAFSEPILGIAGIIAVWVILEKFPETGKRLIETSGGVVGKSPQVNPVGQLSVFPFSAGSAARLSGGVVAVFSPAGVTFCAVAPWHSAFPKFCLSSRRQIF
jgi:hypothetical protein